MKRFSSRSFSLEFEPNRCQYSIINPGTKPEQYHLPELSDDYIECRSESETDEPTSK